MTRSEVIERLRHLSDVGVNCQDDVALILQAANLLEVGEARTEYRVVGEGRFPFVTKPVGNLDAAKRRERMERLNPRLNVRIQSSEVTETRTPWTDLTGEEQ